MADLTLQFELESYWQAGSGRGGGVLLDALAHRDAEQLPYLPGRTVKGLLRDAMYRLEEWEHAPSGLTRCLFGEIAVMEGKIRLETQAGALAFSDARLPSAERAWLGGREEDNTAEKKQKEALRKALFHHISSTAINEHGAAKKASLRSIEVAIPLTLEAEIVLHKPEQLPEQFAQWQVWLNDSLHLIRAIGSHRSRGLGRVKVVPKP